MKTHKCRASEESWGSTGRLSLLPRILATCFKLMCPSGREKMMNYALCLERGRWFTWKEESSPQWEAALKALR